MMVVYSWIVPIAFYHISSAKFHGQWHGNWRTWIKILFKTCRHLQRQFYRMLKCAKICQFDQVSRNRGDQIEWVNLKCKQMIKIPMGFQTQIYLFRNLSSVHSKWKLNLIENIWLFSHRHLWTCCNRLYFEIELNLTLNCIGIWFVIDVEGNIQDEEGNCKKTVIAAEIRGKNAPVAIVLETERRGVGQ